jgi:3-hydroxyisobutyrate dehydrogenase
VTGPSDDIVVIGLGQMGLPLASHLSRSGRRVLGVDVSAERRAAAEAAGLVTAPAIDDQGEAASVLVAVRGLDAVRQTLLGPDGLTSGAPPTVVAITSTLLPSDIVALAAEAEAAGLAVVDAPVSGGVARAADGTLAAFVAGAETDIARARPALELIADRVSVVGAEVGMGQAVKLGHQVAFATTLAGVAEGLRLAVSLGVDEDAARRALATGSAASRVLDEWERLRGFWEGGSGSIALVLDDLALALQADDGLTLAPAVLDAFSSLWPPPAPGGARL